MGLNLCLLHWQADSCPLYHQASPPILIWKRKVSSFSRGVVGSCPGKTRCYGDFPKPLGEKELFEMESVAKKKCSRIFGLEILIIFEIQLPFIFFYFWIFLSFSLLANARSLNISFKNIRWLFFFFAILGQMIVICFDLNKLAGSVYQWLRDCNSQWFQSNHVQCHLNLIKSLCKI